jgi:hypothetical protein
MVRNSERNECKYKYLSITEETRVVEMRIWCIKIGNVLVLHFNPWVETSAGGLLVPEGLSAKLLSTRVLAFKYEYELNCQEISKFYKFISKRRIISLRHRALSFDGFGSISWHFVWFSSDGSFTLIRYQFWCTRCAFGLLKSLRWCSGRKSLRSEKNENQTQCHE